MRKVFVKSIDSYLKYFDCTRQTKLKFYGKNINKIENIR